MLQAAALLGLAVLLPAPLSACAKKDASGQTVEVAGVVRRVGNEPWTRIVITDENGGDWYIAEADAKMLEPFINEKVTVRGRLELYELVLANKKKVGTQREIHAVKVLE